MINPLSYQLGCWSQLCDAGKSKPENLPIRIDAFLFQRLQSRDVPQNLDRFRANGAGVSGLTDCALARYGYETPVYGSLTKRSLKISYLMNKIACVKRTGSSGSSHCPPARATCRVTVHEPRCAALGKATHFKASFWASRVAPNAAKFEDAALKIPLLLGESGVKDTAPEADCKLRIPTLAGKMRYHRAKGGQGKQHGVFLVSLDFTAGDLQNESKNQLRIPILLSFRLSGLLFMQQKGS